MLGDIVACYFTGFLLGGIPAILVAVYAVLKRGLMLTLPVDN